MAGIYKAKEMKIRRRQAVLSKKLSNGNAGSEVITEAMGLENEIMRLKKLLYKTLN